MEEKRLACQSSGGAASRLTAIRYPSEVWKQFQELHLPLERWGWFLGTVYAYDRDQQLVESLENSQKAKEEV